MSEKRISRKELAKQNRKQNKKRKTLRTLLIVAITVILVYITGIYGASLAYLGDFVASGMTYLQIGGGFPVEDDFSSYLQGENMGSGLAVLTKDNFKVYSPTARNVFTYSHSMTNPVVSTSRNRAVLYESNGTSLKVANNHNILFQQEMENNIIHACISDSNRVAVTTRSSSYNGEVRVYNFNMDQRFAWYCATGFPVYSTLSESGRSLAVCAVQTVDDLLENSIHVIDASRGEEKFSITSGSYPNRLIFIDDSRLLIAYSDRLVLWDTANNAQLAQYSFNGKSILALEVSQPYIAVAFGDYNRETVSQVALLSYEFEEKMKTDIPEGVKDLSVARSRIYVLGYEKIYEYDYAANLLSTADAGVLTRGLVTWNGTVVIDSTSVSRVEKTKSR